MKHSPHEHQRASFNANKLNDHKEVSAGNTHPHAGREVPVQSSYADFIPHRIQIRSLWKPLWQFDTPSEFLQGVADALQGLENMFTSAGIVHRDISSSNVYLWDATKNGKDPIQGMLGFIADLEFALVPKCALQETVRPTGVIRKHHSKDALVLAVTTRLDIRQPSNELEVSGTIHFMSREILEIAQAIAKGKGQNVQRAHYEPHHDLEAFILASYYALYRKALSVYDSSDAKSKDKQNYASLVKEYNRIFYQSGAEEVNNARTRLVRGRSQLHDSLKQRSPILHALSLYLSSELKSTYTSLSDASLQAEQANNPIMANTGSVAWLPGVLQPAPRVLYEITYDKMASILNNLLKYLVNNSEHDSFKIEAMVAVASVEKTN